MKILYITKNMDAYKAALYQKDVIDEIKKQAEVKFYGPGFVDYNKEDTIFDILKKRKIDPHCIILGHAWLSDKDGDEVDPHPKLSLDKVKIKKVVILNKEYVNLREKLLYIKKNKFDLLFSHHHDVKKYQEITSTRSFFWPFAVNHNIFKYDGTKKKYDLSFSGILQNQTKNSKQTDIRLQIQNKLFFCINDIPFIQKNKYKNLKIFWNSIPRNKNIHMIARILGKYKRLNLDDYSNLNKMSKIYINTLSPVGLISTRFFENMAAKSLIFCEQSKLYENIFSKNCYVSFNNNLDDFDDKLFYYLNNETKREKIVDNAYNEVMKKHTWEKRVENMIDIIKRKL